MRKDRQWSAAVPAMPMAEIPDQAATVLDERPVTRLRDTPVIIPYFYNWTMAANKKVTGYKASAIGTMTGIVKTSLK